MPQRIPTRQVGGKDSGRYCDNRCDQITGRVEETCCARILWFFYPMEILWLVDGGWFMMKFRTSQSRILLINTNYTNYWRWFVQKIHLENLSLTGALGWPLTSQDSPIRCPPHRISHCRMDFCSMLLEISGANRATPGITNWSQVNMDKFQIYCTVVLVTIR